MAATRIPARRRRARRGSLERPVNARLYRGAFLFLSLPLLILAFSIVRPGALPAPLLPPNFDGTATRELAADFAKVAPDRAPNCRNASSPSAACTTVKPSRSSGNASTFRTESSSSTSRIVGAGSVMCSLRTLHEGAPQQGLPG